MVKWEKGIEAMVLKAVNGAADRLADRGSDGVRRLAAAWRDLDDDSRHALIESAVTIAAALAAAFGSASSGKKKKRKTRKLIKKAGRKALKRVAVVALGSDAMDAVKGTSSKAKK